MARLPDDSDVVTQVERAVTATMSQGVPDMSAIATQLGASPRTLQRRLADAETTFQEVVDTVRRRYAERYLADDRLAIAEVGIRVAVWKGLDLRLGVAALVAPGEKVRVNPTPGIGWSFQF